jgi:hypothetical protein
MKSNNPVLLCGVKLRKDHLTFTNLEQSLKKDCLYLYRFKNKIFKYVLKNNIFFSQLNFVNGSLILIEVTDSNLSKTYKNFDILTIKIENKTYNFYQFKNIKNLNFISNIILFNKELTYFTKKFSLLTLNSKKFSE